MRGIVYWDNKERLILVTEKLGMHIISDYDDIYIDMPKTKGDIVDVDENEITGVISLKSIFGLTFYKNETDECSASEAITYSLENNPQLLIDVLTERYV